MTIIGITGTNGAGKGAVVDYLKQKGFKHFSAREFIVEEIKRRGLSIDRDATNKIGNELRKTYGPMYVIESLYKRAVAAGENAAIESVREAAGAEFLKAHGAFLVAVDADRRVRYERVMKRGGDTDLVSFEEFCMQEDREMAQPDVYDMNVSGVVKLAGYHVENAGTFGELYHSVDVVLRDIWERTSSA